ncbi:MAG: nucleotide exchange factor GrpE [Firmicutes bacterium]|nr:nucleotide exchange factor GrpE [Bacillota bacterium]
MISSMIARGKKNKEDNGDSKLEKKDFELENEVKTEIEESEVDVELTELEKAEKIWLQEKEELLDSLKRKQADLDNLRRISKMEQSEAREYALYEFLTRLLPVLDNIERGLQSARADEKIPRTFIEGQEMIRKQLIQILEQEGVSLIEAEGEPFDPNCHHAVMQVESEEVEPGTVIEELQKGYRHRQRILRPSMVKVCKD